MLGCFYFLFPVHVWFKDISPLNGGGVFTSLLLSGAVFAFNLLGNTDPAC